MVSDVFVKGSGVRGICEISVGLSDVTLPRGYLHEAARHFHGLGHDMLWSAQCRHARNAENETHHVCRVRQPVGIDDGCIEWVAFVETHSPTALWRYDDRCERKNGLVEWRRLGCPRWIAVILLEIKGLSVEAVRKVKVSGRTTKISSKCALVGPVDGSPCSRSTGSVDGSFNHPMRSVTVLDRAP
jgi:hypothetical protein